MWSLKDFGSITARLKNLLFTGQRKNQAFFESAVRAYALRGDEDAKCAAMAAARMAGRRQRQWMIEQLSKMSSNVLKHYPDRLLRKSVAHRISILREDLTSPAWNGADSRGERQKLLQGNAEYLACLDRGDASVFARKHPHLF